MPNGSLSPFTTRTRAPPSAAARNSAARVGGLLDRALLAAARNSAAGAGGSAVLALPAARNPAARAGGSAVLVLPAGPRRPGGRSGNASAMTPLAPTAAAVRQATRAPLLRPPTISGVPGLSGTSSSPDHGPDHGLPRRKAMISRHASSWRAGEPGALAPLIRYGWVTSAVTPPARSAASRTASRSGALTEPPAPCVSTRRNDGGPEALGPLGTASSARAGPWLVPMSTPVPVRRSASSSGTRPCSCPRPSPPAPAFRSR